MVLNIQQDPTLTVIIQPTEGGMSIYFNNEEKLDGLIVVYVDKKKPRRGSIII